MGPEPKDAYPFFPPDKEKNPILPTQEMRKHACEWQIPGSVVICDDLRPKFRDRIAADERAVS